MATRSRPSTTTLIPPGTLMMLAPIASLLFRPQESTPRLMGKSIWDYLAIIFRTLINDIVEQDEIDLKHGKTRVAFDLKKSDVSFGLDNELKFVGTAEMVVEECPPKASLDKIVEKMKKEWKEFVDALNSLGPKMKVEKDDVKATCEEKTVGGKQVKTIAFSFNLVAD